MRHLIPALVIVSLVPRGVAAQSVAETLQSLTARVGQLESRPLSSTTAPAGKVGWPSFVNTEQTETYTRLKLISPTTKRDGLSFTSDRGGGVISLFDGFHAHPGLVVESKSAKEFGRVVADWYNKDGKRVISVGPGLNSISGGLWFFDGTGTRELAFFGSTADGNGGWVSVNGTRVHDYAETFEIANRDGITPGSVVSASPNGQGIALSSKAYDPATVGVISGAGDFQPGMRIGSREDGSTDLPVAVAGQVYLKVSLESGPIAVGDLLVSSSVPGVAMRGADRQKLTGTVIGKALQPYDGHGPALIQMLVLNR
jgi:hypothetical protein